MSRELETRVLHVANGTCTTRLIESAGIPGARSIWADPLYEGPVPGGLTDAELDEVRAHHLAGMTGHAAVDAVDDLKRWRAAIERYESYDELILWFEHDLFDQLNLVHLLAFIRARVPAARAVSLVCVGSFPGHPGFKGLGELAADELASLVGTRRQVTEAQYTLAEEAWYAFRGPTPEALDDLRRANTAALPYLAAALARFLQEFPWTSDGLSRSERRLLQLAQASPIDVPAAFPRMHDGEDAYYITDLSFAGLVDTLSRTTPPLVTVERRSSDGRPIVALTGTGRAVLDRRLDRVATCGIDRWLGGVHLQRGADVWRWDEERGRIVRRPA